MATGSYQSVSWKDIGNTIMMDLNQPYLPYINPIHIAFAVSDLALKKTVTLQSLMNLLDELDPFERDKLLDLVYFTFGVEIFDFPTEDEIVESRYNQFKKNCDQLPLMEHFIVHGIVLEVLNIYRSWSDETHPGQAIEKIKGFIDFRRARGATEEELEKWKIDIEARTVQKKSDLMNARSLYNTFCEKVAKPLLEMR